MRNQGAFYYYYLFLDEPRIRNGGDKNALLYSYCKNYVWTFKKKNSNYVWTSCQAKKTCLHQVSIILFQAKQMRRVTELDGGPWAGECMVWIGVFFKPTVFLRLKNSQLNSIQLITCIEINRTQPIRVGLMGCALVVTCFIYYKKFWIFINDLNVCFSINHYNSHDMPKLLSKLQIHQN